VQMENEADDVDSRYRHPPGPAEGDDRPA
jgi:hypothetical protein